MYRTLTFTERAKIVDEPARKTASSLCILHGWRSVGAHTVIWPAAYQQLSVETGNLILD